MGMAGSSPTMPGSWGTQPLNGSGTWDQDKQEKERGSVRSVWLRVRVRDPRVQIPFLPFPVL